MAEHTGRLRRVGRVALVVSRYNEMVTGRLLEGARDCCTEAGLAEPDLDIFWVPGAFELVVVAERAARTGRYACVVALGAVIRGETAHFEFIAGEATRGLGEITLRHGIPVGFGLLTVDNMGQAQERAGGAFGNKGYEAADAALRTADLLSQMGSDAARP